jgi:hypothetical protein
MKPEPIAYATHRRYFAQAADAAPLNPGLAYSKNIVALNARICRH